MVGSLIACDGLRYCEYQGSGARAGLAGGQLGRFD